MDFVYKGNTIGNMTNAWCALCVESVQVTEVLVFPPFVPIEIPDSKYLFLLEDFCSLGLGFLTNVSYF